MGEETLRSQDSFSRESSCGCRIETRGGTVYWLSRSEPDGSRWVVREHLRCSDTNTVVMQKFSSQSEVDLNDGMFRGRLTADVQVGEQFILEVAEKDTQLLSEPVVAIEAGEIPGMIFRGFQTEQQSS